MPDRLPQANWRRRLILTWLLAPALLWLLLLIVMPHVELAILALRRRVAPHVYAPSLLQFKTFFTEPLYWQVFVRTAIVSALATALTLLLAFPAAWVITKIARGRALDVCTYQGGFALHLAQVCDRVTGVDASRAALEVADRNLELNPNRPAKVDWIEADAFELLRDFAGAGRQFDTIVLDPPAFAKAKRAAEGAMRGYKELNLRALKMLSAGGTLVTCSCSHHVGVEEFIGVVRSAAEDAGHRVQLLETRGAAPDHPAVLTLPETSYLKCLICRID